MNYRVLLRRSAEKSFAALPQTAYERMRDALAELAHNPRPVGCKKLTGREGWRIRIGDYRVICTIDDTQKIVTVLRIGHRRDVYS